MEKLSKRNELVPNTVMAFSCPCASVCSCASRCGGNGTADSAISSSLRSSEYIVASSAISSTFG
ncbi:CLI_3235 family bacteriocin precursor [Ruminiclostridium cellulolyticum]|uniref:Bacteriocin n=1 Tax=Ruminiclostridium cellulolyticum (strain ATCC 35319 / DSM 5812 / JCM 6584 / H10) TaxID=394503 RepID=B8I5Q2_RUMCH|nr:CLI_3235 family bacteriocin precursor [Ruminiclostridium cellulolyticum]ACL74719.1 hypothetical protein Ccel_0332 [Ruminiclostridium cellulolyticum H10]